MLVTQEFITKLRRNLASELRERKGYDDYDVENVVAAFNDAVLTTTLPSEVPHLAGAPTPLLTVEGKSKNKSHDKANGGAGMAAGSSAASDRAKKAWQTRKANLAKAEQQPRAAVHTAEAEEAGQ